MSVLQLISLFLVIAGSSYMMVWAMTSEQTVHAATPEETIAEVIPQFLKWKIGDVLHKEVHREGRPDSNLYGSISKVEYTYQGLLNDNDTYRIIVYQILEYVLVTKFGMPFDSKRETKQFIHFYTAQEFISLGWKNLRLQNKKKSRLAKEYMRFLR